MNMTSPNLQALEEIGLTKSEIKVYLALLKLGPSTTGPIINEAHIANSKAYSLLDKLTEKGLVTYYLSDNHKFFKAAPPYTIRDFIAQKKKKIDEQEKQIEKMMPALLALQQTHKEEKEASIFSGANGIRTALRMVVDELTPGEEVHIMGTYKFGPDFLPHALFFQTIRSKKGVKARFLMNDDAAEIAQRFQKFQPVEVRFLPKEIVNPAIFLVWKDKTIISLPNDFTMFLIKSQTAANAFDAYFKLLWKTGVRKKIE